MNIPEHAVSLAQHLWFIFKLVGGITIFSMGLFYLVLWFIKPLRQGNPPLD